ncbi:MAG: GNAT family N-acetyltransferase [Candidatus Omnitrophica bacterium]|nr:GNAT family N-acetyltransferase [Candidatus Omnitrophota bacterium]
MPQEFKLNIRKFQPQDREGVRSIFHDTAFIGQPATVFFDGRAVISDALTLYFTDYEPHSCFVALVNSEVVGCLIGAKDKAVADKVIRDKISANLFWQALSKGVFLKKKNLIFMFNSLASMFKCEFKAPDFTREYPATLHINIKKEFRGLDIGSKLINAFLSYLLEEKVRGVHLATMSDQGADFFSKLGFNLLHQGERSYFSHILHKAVPLYIYGKKL